MTTSLPPDPWKALGVERDADKADIRAAYKKLVLKCHPDKVQDPALKQQKVDEFQKVQQAYELLNNDAEKAKYEQKLKLAELRAAKIEQDVKSAPNISVPRSSSKYSSTYDIRPSETTSRHKSSPTSGKVYTHYTSTHTRSHEEMPSSRTYAIYEESDKQARRTASYEKYEKPSKRDEERRERDKAERRRRRDEEDLAARLREKDREDRDREKEKDREARKAEKKRLEKLDKEREKERRRDAEDKARRHKSPYVEEPAYAAEYMAETMFDDEKYGTSTSRSEKKRSSSRKKGEGRERDRDRERDRERDKSTSRRTKSPHVNTERKHVDLYEHAASYIGTHAGSLPSAAANAFWKSDQTPPDASFLKPDMSFQKPLAPTPPPVDPEEESIRRSSARAAGRRSSNDAARSKGDLRYEFVPIPGGRPIPNLKTSYSSPPPVPESPPRVTRSQTTHEAYARAIPVLTRNKTWAASGGEPLTAELMYEYESDDDRDRERHRHRSRRHRSPSAQATHRYKVVEGGKTTKLDPHAQYTYVAGGSPSSTRRYVSAADILDGHGSHSPGSTTYHGATVFRHVKEAKKYGPSDVKYTEYSQPSYYEQSSYSVAA